jgi:hypothetical protein
MDFQPVISGACLYIRHFIRHSKTQFLGMAKHPIKINSINKIWLRAAYRGALTKAGLSLEIQWLNADAMVQRLLHYVGKPGVVTLARMMPELRKVSPGCRSITLAPGLVGRA